MTLKDAKKDGGKADDVAGGDDDTTEGKCCQHESRHVVVLLLGVSLKGRFLAESLQSTLNLFTHTNMRPIYCILGDFVNSSKSDLVTVKEKHRLESSKIFDTEEKLRRKNNYLPSSLTCDTHQLLSVPLDKRSAPFNP